MSDSLRAQLEESLGTAYTIERELGGGGMSRVYLATENALGRQVVVKVLPPETAAGVSIERFKREINLAARLQHPHIVPLLTAGESAGLPYFTMPFVDGESLRARLARHGEMPVNEAVRVLREIAAALAYAHDRGIVHRDIKPDNVLLSGGSAMVTDFGVAKALSTSSNSDHGGMTSLGVALGTPAYMSPEQASADPAIDHRADLYAFGVLAYELLTGQPPFAGRTPQGLLAAHVTEAPEVIQKRRPAIPAPLANLVMRCLEKRPADRPQTAMEVVHALDEMNTPSGGMAPTAASIAVSAGVPNRATQRSALIAGVVLIVLATLGVMYYRGRAPSASAMSPAGTSASPKSIAVLPLENAGGDSTMQFFADGMTDELTTTLSKLPGVRVPSLSSTRSAAKAATDARAVGQQLGVASILEGRVRRSGTSMRMSASLTSVADGTIIWSETYEGNVKDVFQMQDSVARAIASALRVNLGDKQQLASDNGTTNAEAHDLYLRARYLEAKFTEPDLRHALELLQLAVSKDPRYAAPWAGIASVWALLADDFVAPRQALPHIKEAIGKSQALNPGDQATKLVEGSIAYWYEKDAPRAERLMGPSVLQLRDTYQSVLYYAMVLWTNGKRDSAATFVRQAVERDPTSLVTLSDAARYFSETQDSAQSRVYCSRLVELHLATTCSIRSMAVTLLRARLATDHSVTAQVRLAEAFAGANQRDSALAMAQKADAAAQS